MDRMNLDYAELTEKIIGCAYCVYNKMEYGFLESVYEKCLMIDLKKSGLHAENQVPISVEYDGNNIGEFIADIIVEESAILELKSVKQIIRAHEVQLVNYLVATGKEIGLILNFGEQQVDVRRKLRDLKVLDHSV